MLVVADVQVGWPTVVVSVASVVTAFVGLAAWFAALWTAKATDRTAKAAKEQANAAEEQANAARADLHRTHTPRLDLRIGLDHGNGNVQAELVNRGPVPLARIDWKVAAFWSDTESYPGSIRQVYRSTARRQRRRLRAALGRRTAGAGGVPHALLASADLCGTGRGDMGTVT